MVVEEEDLPSLSRKRKVSDIEDVTEDSEPSAKKKRSELETVEETDDDIVIL